MSRFRCPVQPCRHALGAMRHGAPARKVRQAVLDGPERWWMLTLDCGHSVLRRVSRYVYEPYLPIKPQFAYCPRCPKKGDTGQLPLAFDCSGVEK